MVVEVPRKKLIEFIVHFEDLLGRAYGFVGLHPHDFPRDEGKNLDSLRGLLVQMKSVAGIVSAVVIDEDEDAKVDGLELVMEHADGIPFVVKDLEEEDDMLSDDEKVANGIKEFLKFEKEDEAKEEIEPEKEPEPEKPVIEEDSGEGDSSEGAEPLVELDEAPVEEPIEVEEEVELDEEVEAESEKDEVQEEAGKESRAKIEALEAQLANLKKTIGD